MLKKIFKNFWIKVACLLAASLLWVYVAAGQNTVGKFPGSIKIKAINVPSGLVAIYDVKTVDIKVMADPSVWRKLSAETFSAYVDLSAHSEGTYEVNVNVVSSVAGVQIVEKNPDKIFVSLEPIITKEINLNNKIEGNAGDGLIAGNVELEPNKVQAKGPKSLVENLTEGTVTIHLNGETGDFTKTVSVSALNEEGKPIDDIEFNPAEVKASVSIVKASNNKTVGVKVKTSGSPKTGYYVSEISSDPATVDITGLASTINEINFVETSVIDITNQSNDINIEVPLSLKNGIVLQEEAFSKVKVKIKFSQIEVAKELVANVQAKNLDSSYYISQVNPSLIKVICSGPAGLINNLKSQDVILMIDFSDKKVSPGASFSVDISPKSFQTPEGVSASSVVPSNITIVVDRKK